MRRNLARFPADFMFQLTDLEFRVLMSQFATSNPGRGGRRKRPFVFTEHGALMAATVLNSPRAVEVSLYVVRAFVYAGQAGGRVAIAVNAAIDFGTCPSHGELILDQTNPYFKPMLTMIMVAYTTGKTISVYTDGSCQSTGVTLTDARLQ